MSQQTPFQLLGGKQTVRELADAGYKAMDVLPDARGIRGMHASPNLTKPRHRPR
jgi:hypothetical protein